MHTTRADVIKWGLEYLDDAGTGAICTVCISTGGSCCAGCRHLTPGVGCQRRNTSCTSWLCGYLLFIFHELGILADWYSFWKQVPGIDFRQDFTPSEFPIEKWIDKRNLKILTAAFSQDLQEVSKKNEQYSSTIKRNDLLFRMITLEYDFKMNGDDHFDALNKRLARLMKDFKRYNAIKSLYQSKK
ncbi:hypothetical protein [Tumebacillus permanentifrigoris]|uniref:DNA mismatch repair protein n=1 Tax=Tumebacillus permanentifrigoris TaxID=378543 RepID=A0A316D785_9BACL|nr:hypothetical protein [Tumebacillus permanentifrigoris]PWK10297.1 hypothetical protein C7459_112119 [Tumebacillus permanentifrigoris]